MIIKTLAAIAIILVILLSLFVLLKTNFEENKDHFISSTDRFVGKWRLIKNEGGEIPDTTEEIDNFIGNNTYTFLSNGIFYHIVNEENTSGSWKINNSLLVLTLDGPLSVLSLTYEYAFSDDNYRVTLIPLEDSEKFMEFEKVIPI